MSNFAVVKTSSSIKIGTPLSYMLIVRQEKQIIFHQSLEAKDVQPATKAQIAITKVIKAMDGKSNYEKRFSKIATMLNSMGEISSFRILNNKLALAI
jgi:hypothetical protein